MTITDFKESYTKYDNMSIWELKNIDELFKTHEGMYEIFEKEYGFPYSKINEQPEKLKDSSVEVVTKLLNYFGDKYFFVFVYGDQHHQDLKYLQDKKVINFGVDIHVINPNRVYVLDMDKSKDLKIYDTM